MRTEAIIRIPDSLATELDKLAGPKRRSAYAIDVLWRDVRRNKQRQALTLSKGAWRREDHPELAQGGAAYFDQIRAQPGERFDGTR